MRGDLCNGVVLLDGCVYAVYGWDGGDGAYTVVGDGGGATARAHYSVDCSCQCVYPAFTKQEADYTFTVIGDRERCLQAGMDDHITKPLRRNDLLNAITKLASEKTTVGRNLLLRRGSSHAWANSITSNF